MKKRLFALLLLAFLSSFSAFADPMPSQKGPQEEEQTEQPPSEEPISSSLGEVRCTGRGEEATCIEV